jgi:diacylglycerol kinase (ATP)
MDILIPNIFMDCIIAYFHPMFETKHIAVLYNPMAGNGKAVSVTSIISNKLESLGVSHEIIKQWPENLQPFSDIWIVGGDGTLNYFINKYPGCRIPLSIFKGGTGNDFSWQLYGDMSTADQVTSVLQAVPRNVDAAICNDTLYINSLGIGFDGEVLKSMKSVRKLGGHFGYLLVVLKKVFSFKEFGFSIRADGIETENRFLIVMVNNTRRTGGGFLVSPLAKIDDGKLDLLLCNKLSVMKRLKALPLIEKGKHLIKDFITYKQVETIRIQPTGTAFTSLDGELIEAKEYVIRVLPGQFLFCY